MVTSLSRVTKINLRWFFDQSVQVKITKRLNENTEVLQQVLILSNPWIFIPGMDSKYTSSILSQLVRWALKKGQYWLRFWWVNPMSSCWIPTKTAEAAAGVTVVVKVGWALALMPWLWRLGELGNLPKPDCYRVRCVCVRPNLAAWGYFPDSGSNPCLLHWELRVATTEQPGKSKLVSFWRLKYTRKSMQSF